MAAPADPKIYHITHLDNLESIVEHGIWSDAEREKRQVDCTVVGMTDIKRRRLEDIEVDCHPGTKVGEYVPFYFCPRSVMLYILHMGNNPGITYTGGQRQILHLQADLHTVLDWADAHDRRWAISDGNAGAYYTSYSKHRRSIDDLDWKAIRATDWRDPDIKDRKQAEFLVYRSFPWKLVELVGTYDGAISAAADKLIRHVPNRPDIQVQRTWYY